MINTTKTLNLAMNFVAKYSDLVLKLTRTTRRSIGSKAEETLSKNFTITTSLMTLQNNEKKRVS